MDLTKDALLALTEMIGGPVLQTKGCDCWALVPSSMKVEDVRKFYPPTRIQQTVNLTTPDSFADYVNRFKDADTLMFAKVTDTDGQFLAVLDYHKQDWQAVGGPDNPVNALCGGLPRYACHRARYVVEQTTEWKRWMDANKKQFNQPEFATWLEENQDLLAFDDTPDNELKSAAEFLELIQNLEGHSNARFNSAMRLDSGKNAFHYDEDVIVKGVQTTKAGQIEMPRILQAGIAPFHGIEKYRVRARLKYRVSGRALTFWFETISPHVVIRDALAGIIEDLKEKTKVPLLLGTLD